MAIFLLDVMIRCPPANFKNIPDGALLFVFIDGDELTKTGYFAMEPVEGSWRLGENIKLWDSLYFFVW